MQDNKSGDKMSPKTERPSYDVTIPAFIRRDQNLTSADILLYSEIRALCGLYGYCWARNEYFIQTLFPVKRAKKSTSHKAKLKKGQMALIPPNNKRAQDGRARSIQRSLKRLEDRKHIIIAYGRSQYRLIFLSDVVTELAKLPDFEKVNIQEIRDFIAGGGATSKSHLSHEERQVSRTRCDTKVRPEALTLLTNIYNISYKKNNFNYKKKNGNEDKGKDLNSGSDKKNKDNCAALPAEQKSELFEILWLMYPNKGDKPESERWFNKRVVTKEDYKHVVQVVGAYLQYDDSVKNERVKWMWIILRDFGYWEKEATKWTAAQKKTP